MNGTVNIILGMFGGLGLFMYGFHITGKSLQNFVSFRFKNLLEKLTKNVFMSTVMGFFMTALVQSSSATLVFLINFIDAGLINLANSMGVIFGANIGTTITVQVISFSLDKYVIPAIGLGALLKLFAKKRSIKIIGEVILGFAVIFLGIMIMKEAVTPLKELAFFKQFMGAVAEHSLYGMFIGFLISALLAALIHSSGATLAIVIALASSGMIPDLLSAVPLIIGAKIGTCVTAFLASINAKRDAKRAALAHFMFNIIEAVITLILITQLVKLVELSSSNLVHQIANMHTLTSIVATLLLIPFTKLFAKMLNTIIPVKEYEHNEFPLFDIKLLETPTVAISSVKNAVIKMGSLTREMLDTTFKCVSIRNMGQIQCAYDMEKEIDRIQVNSFNFIMEISKTELTGYQALVLNAYREIMNDFERIADHVENIVDNTSYAKLEKFNLDTYSVLTIDKFKKHIEQKFNGVYKALSEDDPDLAQVILSNGKKDEKTMYKAQVLEINEKMTKGELSAENGMLLMDLIYNMQRMSYHLRRILYSVLRIHKRYDNLDPEKLED